MGMLELSIHLQATHKDPTTTTPADVLDRLIINEQDQQLSIYSHAHPGDVTVTITFLESKIPENTTFDLDEYDLFWTSVERLQYTIADWLLRREIALEYTTQMGFDFRLLVTMWIDQDQMELNFVPELLYACGRNKIRMYLITNE